MCSNQSTTVVFVYPRPRDLINLNGHGPVCTEYTMRCLYDGICCSVPPKAGWRVLPVGYSVLNNFVQAVYLHDGKALLHHARVNSTGNITLEYPLRSVFACAYNMTGKFDRRVKESLRLDSFVFSSYFDVYGCLESRLMKPNPTH